MCEILNVRLLEKFLDFHHGFYVESTVYFGNLEFVIDNMNFTDNKKKYYVMRFLSETMSYLHEDEPNLVDEWSNIFKER